MKVTRADWARAVLELIAAGRDPAAITVAELCERLQVTRGSFYNYYAHGGMAALRDEAIASWREHRLASLPGSEVGAVRDPLDRLRLLHAVTGEHATEDAGMRLWALGDPDAAAAVADADETVSAFLAAATTDLGFGPDESPAVASVLMAALSAPGRRRSRRDNQEALPALADPQTWEVLLSVLARAAATARGHWAPPGPGDVRVAAGDAPDELALYLAASSLDPAQKRQLRDLAQLLAAQRPGGQAPAAGGSGGA